MSADPAVAALVGDSYAQQAASGLRTRESREQRLLKEVRPPSVHTHTHTLLTYSRLSPTVALPLPTQRKWPQQGWDEAGIEAFLGRIAAMDSNNFLGAAVLPST